MPRRPLNRSIPLPRPGPRAVGRRGHSLAEAMVAVVIIAVVVLGAVSFMQASSITVDKAMLLRTATELAQYKLEQTKGLAYASIVTNTAGANVVIGGQTYKWEIIVTAGSEAADPRADTTVSTNTGHTRSYYKIIDSRVTCLDTNQIVLVRSAVAPP